MNEYIIEIDGIEAESMGKNCREMAIRIAEEHIRAHYYDAPHLTFEVREARLHSETESIHDATADVMQLLLEKNAKYGNDNLCQYGHLGIIVRLSDKLSRLENLTKDGAKDVDEYDDLIESIEDVYKDIAGYGILGLKLMREGKL